MFGHFPGIRVLPSWISPGPFWSWELPALSLAAVSSHKDRSGRNAGREWLPHLRTLSLHPHRTQSPLPASRALPRGWENLGEGAQGRARVLSHPHLQLPSHTCVHSAPPHARVHPSASATARPAPQPPAAIRLSVCPLPAPTEQPSLPPPPERFRSVSIDKSGALPRRRCNGAQRVRGCRGAQAHGGVGVRGAGRIHAWDCTRVTPQVCGCTRVGFPRCVVAHVCARCRCRSCTCAWVCIRARTDVCSARAGLWGFGDPTLGQHWQTGPLAPSGSSYSSAERETEALAVWDSPCHRRSRGDRGSLRTGGPHTATTSDPCHTVLGPASTVTPWLWSHTCGALWAGDPTHILCWDGGAGTCV